MKKLTFIILLLVLFLYCTFIPVNSDSSVEAAAKATKIIELKDADEICDAVKTNDRLKIKVTSYKGKEYTLKSATDECTNVSSFDSKTSDIINGKTGWTLFGRDNYKYEVFVEGIRVKNKKSYGKYSSFYIRNGSKNTSNLNKAKTLSAGDKISLSLNISDKKIKANSYKSLILNIDYGISGDINVYLTNSISYYVVTNKKKHGPYKLDYSSLQRIDTVVTSDSESDTTINRLVSKNLVEGISGSEKIVSIEIVPYDNYTFHKGAFRIYNISLEGYNTDDTSTKKYQKVSKAESVVRHNIVDNMMEEVTIKWGINPKNTTKLYFYHHYIVDPIVWNKNSKQVIYGIPYVNNVDTTIDAFISQTTKSSNKKGAYYLYNFATTYLKDVTSNHNKKYSKGQKIDNNTLYILESKESNDTKKGTQRYKDLTNKNINFISNSVGYYHGLDCSSSTFLAIARELPYDHSMAGSKRYYASGQVEILGGLEISSDKIEKYLRKNNKISSTTQITENLIDEYYGEYMRSTYSAEKIYKAYASVIPGDVVDTRGHAMLVTGYSYVECKNGNHTNKYTDNFCDKNNRGGINPSKSYVIITETGARHAQRLGTDNHVSVDKTGWTYTLNPELTDLKSVDDLYNKKLGLLSNFHVNNTHTFEKLYGKGKGGMYLPFRYKELQRVADTNTVEIPSVKLVIDQTYSNLDKLSQAIYTYMSYDKKIRGTIISNYLIYEIKITVNSKTYSIYPTQTNSFSLYYDIKDEAILKAIKNLDYTKKNKIIVSVRTGPDITSVKTKAGADSKGFITVLDTSNAKPPVKTTGIKLDKTKLSMKIGDKEKVTATISPSNATDKNIIWTSSGSKVASVDENGNITALKAGTVTITAKTRDSGIKAKVKVTVTEPVKSISLNKKTTEIGISRAEKIEATIKPSTASNQKISWTSSDKKVAAVDSTGVIKGISEGTATITATTDDGGKTAKIKVTVVTVPVTDIKLNKKSGSVNAGSKLKVTVTISPTDATNQNVTWTTSNKKIATVNSQGRIKGIAPGTATITVKTEDGNKKATIKVTVKAVPVTDVSLNKTKTTINIGKSETINATISPSNATNKNITWTTSKKSVATVDANGKIKAVKKGTATITATTEDGEKTAKIKVTVVDPTIRVTGVKLNKTSTSMKIGENETIKATISPSDATNKSVIWTSSNNKIASVDGKGVVKGLAEGTATITAKTSDGGKKATIKVTIKKVAVSKLALSKTSTKLDIGNTEKITATVSPSNATYKKVTWTSSDENIAYVDSDGTINGVNKGEATITATTEKNEKSVTIKVTITEPIVSVTSITVDKTSVTLDKGESALITYSVMPLNATNREVTWESSNTKVATVDGKGNITGISKGTATITVKTKDGEKTATINVSVKSDEDEPKTPVMPEIEPEKPKDNDEDHDPEELNNEHHENPSTPTDKPEEKSTDKPEEQQKPEEKSEEKPKEEKKPKENDNNGKQQAEEEQTSDDNEIVPIAIVTVVSVISFGAGAIAVTKFF